MGHLGTDLKNRHAFILTISAAGFFIGAIYFAQVKIPENSEKKKIEYKSMQIPVFDSIFEQDTLEEFQNLPISDQRTIQSSTSEFWRSLPHY